MLRYLLIRLATSLLVLLALSVLAFMLVRLVPGDTVVAMMGMQYDPTTAAQLRERMGLDRPLPVQYTIWLQHVIRGDFGTSASGQPVLDELVQALPVTVQLASFALLFAVGLGVPMGLYAAMRRGKAADWSVSLMGVLGLSVPGFWLGTLLILCFALWLRWLPSGGYVAPTYNLGENLRHMILPSIALGLAVLAVLARTTRSAMIDVTSQVYIRTALAKGLPPRIVLWKHIARNGILPVLTMAGLQAGYLLGGSIVIEEVFALPGLGRLILRALGQRDYPTLQAAILFIGMAFILINLIVDLLYAWADPRISYTQEQPA